MSYVIHTRECILDYANLEFLSHHLATHAEVNLILLCLLSLCFLENLRKLKYNTRKSKMLKP